MSDRLLRTTLLGAGLGGLAFAGLGLYLNAATGAGPLSNPGPVGILAVIGLTVGGLVAPLFRRDRADRRESRHENQDRGNER